MTGKILIAHPLLNDGFFNRSVIYMTQHGEEGSLGFVINFKTQFLLRDVRPQVKNGNWPIYEGGPVAKNQLFFLHRLGEQIPNALHIKDDLFFGGDFEEVLRLIDHDEIPRYKLKFFAGYSGWDKEQLEKEIENQSWFVADAETKDIFQEDFTEIWGDALSRTKRSLKIFSEIGYDPSLN